MSTSEQALRAEIVAVRPPAGAAATNPDELPLNGEGDGDVADDQ